MSTQAPTAPKPLTRKDFQTDQDVRWCPGCGDYAILSSVQKLLPELGVPREKIVIVSGIGCSSRFPYYIDTYGIHSIHGRAPTFATGIKIARPDLSVWIVTGDGDGLSIGGNHLMHIIRRNLDVNILLFNNEIYGLTKGQTSPTSRLGTRTKSTPLGSHDRPVNPISFALGANATFVARSIDVDAKHLGEVLHRAFAHRGTSFVELLQNCNIFNDGIFDHVRDKAGRADNAVVLEEGQPLVFGANSDKGIRIVDHQAEIVALEGGSTDGLAVHSETAPSGYAFTLSELNWPQFPTPVGVFRAVEAPVYEEILAGEIEAAKAARSKDLQALVDGPETWTVH